MKTDKELTVGPPRAKDWLQPQQLEEAHCESLCLPTPRPQAAPSSTRRRYSSGVAAEAALANPTPAAQTRLTAQVMEPAPPQGKNRCPGIQGLTGNSRKVGKESFPLVFLVPRRWGYVK